MGVPEYEKRIELLKYMYYALRLLDDICDWDTLINFTLEQRKKVIEWKFWVWLYDLLINKVKKVSWELWVLDWIQYSIDEIVWSIEFDVDRMMDSNKYRTKEELENNFHKMDIDWTIFWTAIIFWLNPLDSIKKLWWLWETTRISYNIKDLQDDISKKLINIPIEDLKKYWINNECLDKLKNWDISNNIKKWIEWEINEIKVLLDDYNKKFSLLSLVKNWGIDLSFSTNYFRKLFNNLLLKYIVLPKWYINWIDKVVWKYS
jgi:hypothetical protein